MFLGNLVVLSLQGPQRPKFSLCPGLYLLVLDILDILSFPDGNLMDRSRRRDSGRRERGLGLCLPQLRAAPSTPRPSLPLTELRAPQEGGPHLPLLPRDEHVLIAVPALLGGAVDAAAGVDDVADEVPVGRVGRGHDCEVERQLEQLLHGLEDQGQAPRVKVLRVSGFPALPRALRTRPAQAEAQDSPAAAPSPR